MFELLSTFLKYIFITIIYIFLFSIIRLIYLDIRSIYNRMSGSAENVPYLKLINRRDELYFKVEESYVLSGKKVLGRSSATDIPIGDPFLSQQHAEFYSENGTYYLKDLGSKNGTVLNGNRVTQDASLKNGDKIEVGQLSFLFVDISKEGE